MEDLVEILVSHRNKMMTQKEFAERLGITQQAVSAFETKKYTPSIKMIMKMIEVLEITLILHHNGRIEYVLWERVK